MLLFYSGADNWDELFRKLVEWLKEWLKKSGVTAKQILTNPTVLERTCDLALAAHPLLRVAGKERTKGFILKAAELIKREEPPEQPTSEQEIRVRLLEVGKQIEELYGDAAATKKNLSGYKADRDVQSDRALKELEVLEQSDFVTADCRIQLTLLKARLYGCWQKMHGSKGNQQLAVERYEEAIRLSAGNAALEAEARYRYGKFSQVAPEQIGGGKERACENFKRGFEIAPDGSEIKRQCAEEVERCGKRRWWF